jgi:hypothetical protein
VCVLIVIAAGFALQGRAAAQDPSGWTVSWENDSFVPQRLSSDESYTNGVRFSLRRGWGWGERLGNWWRTHYPLARSESRSNVTSALVIGQNFFTPLVITTFEPDPIDRPYAGLLYGGVRMDLTESLGQNPKLFQFRLQHALEFDLGVLGPPALAGQTQTGVHLLRKSRIPKGWEHQVGTELAPSITVMTQAKIGTHFIDVVPHGGVLVGTAQTYAFGGVTGRVGWRMSGFPALLLRNTATAAEARSAAEIEFVAGIEGRAFARNAFVEGNMLGSGPRLSKESLVGDLRWGLAARLLDWRLSYSIVRRSSEVREAGPADKDHNYGSVSLSYEPGPSPDSVPRLLGFVTEKVLAPVFRNTLFEAGIGGGVSRTRPVGSDLGSEEGVAMRFGAAKRVTSWVAVGVEVNGIVREWPAPDALDERHLDTFLVNNVLTVRAERRAGPGLFHARGGVGLATAHVQSTLGLDHNYTRDDSGWGYLVGTGYALRRGEHAAIGLDLSWNRLDVESTDGPSADFLASTFTIQWRP